jgi:AbiV family abortive infection protein
MSAWENASQLLAGAVTLHAKGNNGPARSLAISAREEIGKFFAAMMYCMGVLPVDRFAETFWNHSSKQALGAVLAMLGGPVKPLSQHVRPAVDIRASSMPEMFDEIATNISTLLATAPMPGGEGMSRNLLNG